MPISEKLAEVRSSAFVIVNFKHFLLTFKCVLLLLLFIVCVSLKGACFFVYLYVSVFLCSILKKNNLHMTMSL